MHRDALLSQGYDYPGFGRHVDMPLLPGHHGIPDRLRRHGEVPPGVVENLNTLPDDRTIIFSSEDLAHLNADQVRALVKGLGSTDVEVVFYARRWDHLLPSVWQELIKHGHSRSYLEFHNAQLAAPMASIYLNYMNSLNPWAQVLSPKKLRIFSYDTMLAAGDDIVTHFCREVLGWVPEKMTVRRDNPRQTPVQTEILRMLNKMAFVGKPSSPAVRFALQRKTDDLEEELADLSKRLKPYVRHAPFCPPFVFAHVERAFLRTYGQRVENLAENGLLLMDRGIAASPYVSQDYLLDGGIVAALRNVLKQLGPI